MTSGVPTTVATFVLAALPGVVVLEIFEFGRPRIRERNAARAFAVYLILSLFAWIAAALILGADDRLGGVIDLTSSSKPTQGNGSQLVSSYIALSWRLLVMAIVLGFAIRGLSTRLAGYAFAAVGKMRRGEIARLSWTARVAIALSSLVFAWDELFVRLARRRKAQVVHIRFRDGTDAYGVFAGGGRADYQADGQGLMLDAELIEHNGRLVQIAGSNGIFIPVDAIASVAFIDDPEAGRPQGQLELLDRDRTEA